MTLRGWALGTALLALLGVSATAQARAKSDQVTVLNGNVINGEIKQLLQGKLTFKTDSLGTVTVEWEDILFLHSEFHYEVRVVGGARYYGTMVPGSRPGRLQVVGDQGRSHELALLEVVELRPIEESVADRFDVRIGLGVSFEKASDVTAFTLNLSGSYEDERGINAVRGRSNRTEQTLRTVSSNQYSLSRQFWTRRANVVRWLDAGYESNDELNLDHRYTLGLGLGKALVDNHRQSLVGVVGVQASWERSQDVLTRPPERLNSVEGVLGLNYFLWRFDTPELDLETNLTVYPGITESGRWRGDGDLRLSWELVEDLYWDINGWYTYDNRSPSLSDSDYGISTGLGWSY